MKTKQTGFLFKLRDTDYVTGSSPLTIRDVNPDGNWSDYIPVGEFQYKYGEFDTMSCTTFSALNIVETWVNWLIQNNKITASQLQTLNKLGFFKDGKFNASDRFTAIMSGTTRRGNYFQAVWDSIRHDGILPESDLPFGGNTWEEYMDKNIITEEMKQKAVKILDILKFNYEWVSFAPVDNSLIPPALKQSPLHIAIPVPGMHAVEMISEENYFDTYEPYIKKISFGISYILKVIVTVPYIFTKKMKFGDKNEDVRQLQIKLGVIFKTGYFWTLTKTAVQKFQEKNGLKVDGIVGPKTLAILNK